MHEQVVVRESEIDLSQPCSPTINLDTLDNMHSNVYSCFLNASKAFDRVNHYVLFEKLIKRGIPVYIVMILIFWYTTQKMYVRWKNIMFNNCSVTNGVRQGGIISPYFLCLHG